MVRQSIPNPSLFRDMKQWATALYEATQSSAPIADKADPTPILLAHRATNVMERASQAGILLYDPVYDTPVVAESGAWAPLRSQPLFQLSYDTAAATNGATLPASATAIPFSSASLDNAPWATFNPTSTDFTLKRGTYVIEGFVTIAKTSTGNKGVTGYLAETSDLTTPVGSVTMATVYMPSAVTTNSVVLSSFRGQVDVDAETAYSMVVLPSATGTRFGTAHGITGYDNNYAKLAISLVGLNE